MYLDIFGLKGSLLQIMAIVSLKSRLLNPLPPADFSKV